GEWLALTPDLEITRHNLGAQRRRILDRAAPFPADIAAEIYAHDPIGRAALANFKRPCGLRRDHRCGVLGNEATGLAFTLKGVILRHVFVERVGVNAMADWRREKGLDGVRAAKEFHLSVAASTGGFLTYHSEWLRLSGVSKKFSAVHVHRALCEALRLMRSYDQVDASTLATGEHLTRWMIQTELAVERNPLQPDYAGLDIVDGTAQLPDGRAATAKFTEWVSNRLKERASLWKQERLYQQERRHHRGKGREADGGDDTDSEEYGEGNKKKKKKKKKGVQQWIMDDLHRRVALYGECPDNITEDSVMGDLGQRSDLYNQEAKHLVSIDLDKIKILKRRLVPKDAKTLAPPEAVGYLKHFDELVERTPREMELLQANGDLRRSRRRRLELYKALDAANLLDFRRRRKARVGIFTVRKKDGAQRLILDARQANACHRAPPTTRLSTPPSLTALDLTAQTLESDGFGGILGEEAPTVTAESGDDAFSREQLKEELDIDVDAVYDDDFGQEIPRKPGEKVFCAFKGVPMGWSWALYFANEIVCHQVSTSSGRPGHDEIRDRQPPPRLLPGQPVVGTYVDNVHVFGGRPGEAGQRMDAVAEHFGKLGIPFEVDGVEHLHHMDSLGMRLSFDKGRSTAMAKPERAWKLWHATRGLLRRRRLSGELLRVYLGLANFHFQLMRPALSVFSACYKFAAENVGRRATVWPTVRSTLEILLIEATACWRRTPRARNFDELFFITNAGASYSLRSRTSQANTLPKLALVSTLAFVVAPLQQAWEEARNMDKTWQPVRMRPTQTGSSNNDGLDYLGLLYGNLRRRCRDLPFLIWRRRGMNHNAGGSSPQDPGAESRLRHIATDRNVADAPSRQWGPDLERKGYHAKKRRSDIDDVTQGIRVGADLGLGPATATPSSSSTRPPLSSSTVASTTATGSTARAVYFLEVFSGTARLTEALALQNLQVLPDIEVRKGRQFDVLRPACQRVILDLIRDGKIWAIHFGTLHCVEQSTP
ncbi:unnamed protein product, partial [Symbiodinium pilosum]